MSDPAIASAEYREVAEGRLTENRRTYPLAAFLEGKPLRRYVHYKRRYSAIIDRFGDGTLPPTFEQTQYCHDLVGAHGSPIAARAVRDGNLSVLSWLTGLTRRDSDFSGAELYSKLVHRFRRDGYCQVFVGSTDGGKTNTALLGAGLHLRDQPDAQLATNVTTLEWEDPELQQRTHVVETRTELEAVADRYDDVVAVLDELSQQANAQTKNYEVNDQFYPIMTYKSKLGLRLVLIFHREDGRDAAPAIREHATDFVVQRREADDLGDDSYHAEFYEEVADGEPSGHRWTLRNLPAVSASYDPDETATFDIST